MRTLLTIGIIVLGSGVLNAADPAAAGAPPTTVGHSDPAAVAAATDLLNAIGAQKVYAATLLATFENGIGDARAHFQGDELVAFNAAIEDAKALLLKSAPWSDAVPALAQRFAEQLSASELTQMKTALTSPAGLKTMALMPQLLASQMASAQQAMIKLMPAVQELVSGKMAAAREAQVLAHLPPGVALGKPFPEIAGTAIDGRVVSLQALKGTVVLVDFWATWCGPCMRAMPEIIEDYKGLHAQGLEIIGISLDEEQPKLAAVVKQQGMPWPQLFDGKSWDSELAKRFEIRSIPSNFLINRDGTLAAVDASGDTLVQAIKKAQSLK